MHASTSFSTTILTSFRTVKLQHGKNCLFCNILSQTYCTQSQVHTTFCSAAAQTCCENKNIPSTIYTSAKCRSGPCDTWVKSSYIFPSRPVDVMYSAETLGQLLCHRKLPFFAAAVKNSGETTAARGPTLGCCCFL